MRSASSLPSVPTWAATWVSVQFFFNASVDRVTVLDNFQVLDLAARFFPAFLFPARRPTANAVDGVRRVAAHLDGVAGLDFCFGHAQGVIERVQFGGVVGPHGVVQAIPQFREFAGSIHHDAGAGIAGVGFTGAVAINADIELVSGMHGSAFAVGCAGFLLLGVLGGMLASPPRANACSASARVGKDLKRAPAYFSTAR